jgi:glutamyl-tRNA synthetase
MNPRTRFAPSPTGYLHIGGVRTALYAWLFARHHHGTFLLRIEDTDRERSTDAAVRTIFDGLQWLGIEADEPPIYQTRRFGRYAEVAEKLLAAGRAYRCYCTREELEDMRAAALARGLKPRYDGRCRNGVAARGDVAPVVRFKNPTSGSVDVADAVKGRIVFSNEELDDLIIVRSDGTPTYNFAVVVDDADMSITHVIRGDDHINNTPRQINLLRALGFEPPTYAHLPMIHGSDGTKLSKRHGAVNVLEYRAAGFLPQALLNYLLRLGWAHGDQEIFDVDEMIRLFDLGKVSRSAANFDAQKLRWVNQQHIAKAAEQQLVPALEEHLRRAGVDLDAGPSLPLVVTALRGRSTTVVEMAESAKPYFVEEVIFDPDAVVAHLTDSGRMALDGVRRALLNVSEWSEEATQRAVEQVATALNLKLGKVAQPLRVALTGRAASPPIGATLVLIGRERALRRIDRVLNDNRDRRSVDRA